MNPLNDEHNFYRGRSKQKKVAGREINERCTIGQNQVVLRHLIIHFSTSLGVSEQASERMSERAKQTVRSKQMSERSECANGRAGGPVPILGCSEPPRDVRRYSLPKDR